MKEASLIADTILECFHSCQDKLVQANSGGIRRGEKGKSLELMINDILLNIIEDNPRLGLKQSCKISTPRENYTPIIDRVIYDRDNDRPVLLLEMKDYTDATMMAGILFRFMQSSKSDPNLKCVSVSMQVGADPETIADMIELSENPNIKAFNLTTIKRVAKNTTYLLDYPRASLIEDINDITHKITHFLND